MHIERLKNGRTLYAEGVAPDGSVTKWVDKLGDYYPTDWNKVAAYYDGRKNAGSVRLVDKGKVVASVEGPVEKTTAAPTVTDLAAEVERLTAERTRLLQLADGRAKEVDELYARNDELTADVARLSADNARLAADLAAAEELKEEEAAVE